MTTTYRFFSASILLNTIALLFLLLALGLAGWGLLMCFQYSINPFSPESLIYILALGIVVVFDYWMLTATVLPLIKINGHGVTAYSLVWKRRITWTNLRAAKLVEVQNMHEHFRKGMLVRFAVVKQPKSKPVAIVNNGVRVITFILITDSNWYVPREMLLKGLYTHKTIAGKQAIAWQFDDKTWKIVSNHLSTQS